MKRAAIDRFRNWYVVNEETGCWDWQGFTLRGYGRFWHDGGQLAHRFAYEHYRGAISDDLVVDHLCRNRSCVNPDHMELVTPAENTRRGERATRATCPSGHPYDKVTTNRRTGHQQRRCSTCDREYFRVRYQREKAAGLRR